ncbi:hypothetical protein DFH28DRAFT_985777 [Melampsora americana]|nr:hypothetical protein DFH28DRAFT_985777 [Melampsora americana]
MSTLNSSNDSHIDPLISNSTVSLIPHREDDKVPKQYLPTNKTHSQYSFYDGEIPLTLLFNEKDSDTQRTAASHSQRGSISTLEQGPNSERWTRGVSRHQDLEGRYIEELYHSIRQHRSHLKRLNDEFLCDRSQAIKTLENGINGAIRGWIIVGKGVELLHGAQNIIGMTRKKSASSGSGIFWSCFCVLVTLICLILGPISLLTMTASPELRQTSWIFQKLNTDSSLIISLISITAPSILSGALLLASVSIIHILRKIIPDSLQNLQHKSSNSASQIKQGNLVHQIANSISTISSFFLAFESMIAIIIPALLLTQPSRWKSIKNVLKKTQTPRERVLSLWPHGMNSAISRTMMFVQHRNIRSLYRRGGQNGGRTELTMVSILALALGLQSGFVGFILFSRKQWLLASFSSFISCLIILISCPMMLHDWNCQSRSRLDPGSRLALKVFEKGPKHATQSTSPIPDQRDIVNNHQDSGPKSTKSPTDIVNITLNSTPNQTKRAIPLPSESLDDLDLPWDEAGTFSHEILYPPVLMQRAPAIWLPKEAEEEAKDLTKYWNLDAFYEEGISIKHLNLY